MPGLQEEIRKLQADNEKEAQRARQLIKEEQELKKLIAKAEKKKK